MANYPVDVILLQIAWEASNPAVRMGGNRALWLHCLGSDDFCGPVLGRAAPFAIIHDILGLTGLVDGACSSPCGGQSILPCQTHSAPSQD